MESCGKVSPDYSNCFILTHKLAGKFGLFFWLVVGLFMRTLMTRTWFLETARESLPNVQPLPCGHVSYFPLVLHRQTDK